MKTLDNINWLDDNIINFYMELLNERSKLNHYPSVWCVNTFFFTTLESDGYSKVRRWSKRAKVDVFNLDFLIVPVHLGAHWTCAAVNFNDKNVTFYDSMRSNGSSYVSTIFNYLLDEHNDKKSTTIYKSKWTLNGNGSCPQQRNGGDCGVFTCCVAENLSRGLANWNFDQSQMQFIRKKMCIEIMSQKILE